MSTVHIERLTLHTGPLTDSEAHELAQQVAETVSGLALPPAGSVRIEVPQPANGGFSSLRDAVVHAVEAALVEKADEQSRRENDRSAGGAR